MHLHLKMFYQIRGKNKTQLDFYKNKKNKQLLLFSSTHIGSSQHPQRCCTLISMCLCSLELWLEIQEIDLYLFILYLKTRRSQIQLTA